MKSYLRFLSRNKLYTAIMVVGLSVSLAFVIIFTCYVRQQLAVCNHYPDSDQIYLVGMEGRLFSYHNLAQELRESTPELENAVLVQDYYNSYTYEGEVSSQEGIIVVGKDFFDVFQTRFLYGTPEDFNTKTNAFVTESFALRHGMEDVIGKKLVDGDKEFVIAGIVEDFTNTVFRNYEVILNAASDYFDKSENYMSSATKTFIKVKEGADMDAINFKVNMQAKEWSERTSYSMEKVADLIRLDKLYLSELNDGMLGIKKESGSRLLILCIVVVFLLFSAIINYVNLNAAIAERRDKEQTIRHILGEDKKDIVMRILAESFIFIIISFLMGIAIATSVVGGVNDLLKSLIPIELSFTLDYIGIYCLLAIFIAVICAIAVSLNTFRIRITSSVRHRKSMSRLFIGLQFILSFVMISSALTMELQMKYMLERDMNAHLDNIYRTNYTSPELLRQIEGLPFVKSIGMSTGYPGNYGMTVKGQGDAPKLALMYCDSIAFRLFGFNKIEQFNSSSVLGTWMSETAANHYQISGDQRQWNGPGFNFIEDVVTGIIEDTPTTDVLKMSMSGLALISVQPKERLSWGSYMLEVEETKEHRQVVDSLVSTLWMEEQGQEAFNYGFLRDLNKREYEQTARDMRLIEMFMLIAVMLSCLAFFAMSLHYAEENTKHIAVHKVFGGSFRSELIRCMRVYFKIISVSVIIGLPPAILVSKRYLEQFSYKYELADKWWIFLVAICISLLISTVTVLWQTIRAARTNPAEALKKE